MDHLPLPDGVKHFIVVPYEAPSSQWYDNEGFIEFPESRGWTEEQLRGGDETSLDEIHDPNGFTAKTKADNINIEQFFQTWLFFGLVIDVLKMGGVEVSTEDFLKRRGQTKARIIDTSKLPGFLVDWEEEISSGNTSRAWKILNRKFETAATVLDQFCRVPDTSCPLNQDKPRPWPVRDEISMSIIALVSTLRRAAINACKPGIDVIAQWPTEARSGILTRRLQGKWCVADVTTTMKQLPIDGQYYMAGSPGLPADELDHHAKCLRTHCLYEYDKEMYVTRHTTAPYHKPGCRTTINYGGQLGPERGQTDWVDAISRIIDKNAIPIALWVKGLRSLWSVEYHFSGQRTPGYVAISHVWADGKGNPKGNSLPECQIDRIQRLVEKVTWEGRKPVPTNPNESNGIGFWMDTLCIPVDDEDRKDKAIKNMRLVYSHAKAVLVLDEWLESMRSDAPPLEIITRIYGSNWLKRLWTHQEGFLPPALWFQFADRSVEVRDITARLREQQSSLQATGIHISFPINAEMRLIHYVFAMAPGDAKDKWRRYGPLSSAMSERQTSRLADETLCLATIIDIDLTPFLRLPSKPDGKAAQRRMEKFVETLGRFEMDVIFNNYDRLEKRGYKWAPRSLLNLRTAELTRPEVLERISSPFEEVNGQLGLLARYHGFLVNFADGRPSFAATERGCAIQCQGSADSDEDIDEKWFVVQLPPNEVEWTKWKTYAVILSSIPSSTGRSAAVVASVESGPDRGIYIVEHESIATVWIQDEPPKWVDTVEARLLKSNTGWLVI
ncbi:hypothetical protein BJX99DRAFT_245633 [Aspergillus californicus]